MSEKSKKTEAAEVAISEEAKAAAEEAKGSEEETVETEEKAETTPSLEEQLLDYKEQVARQHDLHVRAVAELENYRKRAARERQDLLKFGNENLLRDMLPVIDNLERAVDHAKSQGQDTEGLLEGVEMTLTQFKQVLAKFGVTPVEALGQPFDPACHEAMGQVPDGSVPPNSVVQEMQKGYLLNERLLRPSMVMIAKTPEEDKTTAADGPETNE